MVEEYTLSGVDCPLGTIVGPGRYGMYWKAVRLESTSGWKGVVFQSVMPTDLLSVVDKPEPDSVTEVRLRQQRRQYGASISNT